jgi:phage regulator Rha-like protein
MTPATHPKTLPAVVLHGKDAEPRIDSKTLAGMLKKGHRPLVAQIDKFRSHLDTMGKVFFEKTPSTGKTGQNERLVRLNEDQAFFLLTLSRNTPHIVELKARLVREFGNARRAEQVHQAAYLPTHHALGGRLKALEAAPGASAHVYMNVNRLINKAAGVEAGQRRCNLELVSVVQQVAFNAVSDAQNHKEAYARVKTAVVALGGLLGDIRGLGHG